MIICIFDKYLWSIYEETIIYRIQLRLPWLEWLRRRLYVHDEVPIYAVNFHVSFV